VWLSALKAREDVNQVQEEITNFGVLQKCYIVVESIRHYSVQPPANNLLFKIFACLTFGFSGPKSVIAVLNLMHFPLFNVQVTAPQGNFKLGFTVVLS
jgi:hypothetical protein